MIVPNRMSRSCCVMRKNRLYSKSFMSWKIGQFWWNQYQKTFCFKKNFLQETKSLFKVHPSQTNWVSFFGTKAPTTKLLNHSENFRIGKYEVDAVQCVPELLYSENILCQLKKLGSAKVWTFKHWELKIRHCQTSFGNKDTINWNIWVWARKRWFVVDPYKTFKKIFYVKTVVLGQTGKMISLLRLQYSPSSLLLHPLCQYTSFICGRFNFSLYTIVQHNDCPR